MKEGVMLKRFEQLVNAVLNPVPIKYTIQEPATAAARPTRTSSRPRKTPALHDEDEMDVDESKPSGLKVKIKVEQDGSKKKKRSKVDISDENTTLEDILASHKTLGPLYLQEYRIYKAKEMEQNGSYTSLLYPASSKMMETPQGMYLNADLATSMQSIPSEAIEFTDNSEGDNLVIAKPESIKRENEHEEESAAKKIKMEIWLSF